MFASACYQKSQNIYSHFCPLFILATFIQEVVAPLDSMDYFSPPGEPDLLKRCHVAQAAPVHVPLQKI